jgi:hypothetical protein
MPREKNGYSTPLQTALTSATKAPKNPIGGQFSSAIESPPG